MTITSQEHFRAVAEALGRIDDRAINDLIQGIVYAHRSYFPILTCGNGGSAATAIHLASDLRSLGILSWDMLSPSKVTQIGNDIGYHRAFAEQYEATGGVVVAFSGSGTSRNISELFNVVENGDLYLLTSDMLSGESYEDHGQWVLRVASRDYEVIEDVHLAICHAVKKELIVRLRRQ